jgi:hypothetical protein
MGGSPLRGTADLFARVGTLGALGVGCFPATSGGARFWGGEGVRLCHKCAGARVYALQVPALGDKFG